MAGIFDNPSDNFFNAFSNANAAGQLYTDTLRKNLAFNALQATYGDVVGDIDLATKAQTYGHNEKMNPLLVDSQQLQNEGQSLTNADAANRNAFNVTDRQQKLESGALSNRTAADTAERTQLLQQASDAHRTLSGALASLETGLTNATTPEARGLLFDEAVVRLAPLLGVSPNDLTVALGSYKQRIQQEGAAAIPSIRQELDAALTAGMTPEERVQLEKAGLDRDIAQTKLETAKVMQANGGMTPAQKLAAEKEQRKLDGEKRAADQKITAVEQQADRTLAAVDKAKQFAIENASATGPLATKVMGVGIGTLGGTPQAKMEKLLDPIRTNVMLAAMDELARMDARLTPMSDSDRAALEQMLGSLDPAAGKDALLDVLDNIAAFMEQAKVNARQSFEAAYGDDAGAGDDETLPMDDSELWGPSDLPDNPMAPPTVGDAAQQPPPDVDPELWQFLTDEEKALWLQ